MGWSARDGKGRHKAAPLSPLLSNVLFDRTGPGSWERRGHRFCRYADDCNIYVRSKRAGHRIMASLTHYLETHLRLKINTEKSAVGSALAPELSGLQRKLAQTGSAEDAQEPESSSGQPRQFAPTITGAIAC
ncbi:reverse transcriptase domain-containing protein [Marinobacter sp. Arc7-DN-1]|uniref:reverse transcriptase domain-containing protein n=1 Tax=Marinobacter sp. Arc7-DN-1 TaxID=2304594 RepID=UPI0039B6F8EB